MCYFHVILNVRKKYVFKKSSNRKLFTADVRSLHLSPSEAMFDVGCSLFVQKWSKAEREATRLIKKSFFQSHRNWYVGVAPRIPKHNNGLENFNSTMKRCRTEHRRQPMKKFLSTALAIVRQRSLEYLKDKDAFSNELKISDQLLTLGMELDLKFLSKPMNPDGSVDFYALSSEKPAITLEDLKLYEKRTYESFSDFVSRGLSMRIIKFPRESNQWKEAQCSCSSFDKWFMCKHIISIANTLGLLPEPENEELNFDDEPLFPTSLGHPKKKREL